ncbi:hypothetical protein D3C86_1103280 [compost metagenome]
MPDWSGKTLRATSQPLARLTRELMENADLWARTDTTGSIYARGVRAITLRLVDIDDKNRSKFCGSNPSLNTYLQSMLLQKQSAWTGTSEGGRTGRNFIELTIIDSGPGLARRWLASHPDGRSDPTSLDGISLEDEAKAVAKCFQKWGTSSHDVDRGIGLFAVAKLLRERNGFMRLRTGRLAYFFGTDNAVKNFQERSDKSGGTASGYALLDDGTHIFKNEGKVEFFLSPWGEAPLAALEGTTYSILLPVQGA